MNIKIQNIVLIRIWLHFNCLIVPSEDDFVVLCPLKGTMNDNSTIQMSEFVDTAKQIILFCEVNFTTLLLTVYKNKTSL